MDDKFSPFEDLFSVGLQMDVQVDDFPIRISISYLLSTWSDNVVEETNTQTYMSELSGGLRYYINDDRDEDYYNWYPVGFIGAGVTHARITVNPPSNEFSDKQGGYYTEVGCQMQQDEFHVGIMYRHSFYESFNLNNSTFIGNNNMILLYVGRNW